MKVCPRTSRLWTMGRGLRNADARNLRLRRRDSQQVKVAGIPGLHFNQQGQQGKAWVAYTIVISEEQHWAKRPEKQPIVSIRSVNSWPLVGMTVSFLKSVVMHEAYPHLFLQRYTRERALFCALHATCLRPVNLLPDIPGSHSCT